MSMSPEFPRLARVRSSPSQISLAAMSLHFMNTMKETPMQNTRVFKTDLLGFEHDKSNLDPADLDSLMQILQKGVFVWRYARKSKPKREFFTISHGDSHIMCGLKSKNKLLLSSVVEVRRGRKTKAFHGEDVEDSRCLSIITSKTSLDVAFGTTEECTEWCEALTYAVRKAHDVLDENYYVTRMWKECHLEGSMVNDKTLAILLKKLDFSISTKDRTDFRILIDSKGGKMSFESLLDILHKFRVRSEIDQLYEDAGAGPQGLPASKFLRFLHKVQQDIHLVLQDAENIIKAYEGYESAKYMSLMAFEHFMNSADNLIFDPKARRVYQDMTLPITRYFISSSHNTYLEGDQLKSDSSVNQYINCLKSNNRCLELDLWDGDDGEPIIYHGHTLTSRIKAVDVIKAIKDYAFINTDYPVILTLENHMSKDQQVKAAQYFTDVLGDMLLVPVFLNNPFANVAHLPSPEELRRKILLRSKIGTTGSSANMGIMGNIDLQAAEPGATIRTRRRRSRGLEQVSSKLTSLVYLRHAPFTTLSACLQEYPWQTHSFSETKFQQMIPKDSTTFVRYNIKNFSRIYPKGTRVDSSNFNPVIGWVHGIQMVALNFQKQSEEMWLYNEFFADNGGCGWVLKPACLGPGTDFDPSVPMPDPFSLYNKVTIHIFSARQLPKRNEDVDQIVSPHVALDMFGIHGDSKSVRTKTIQDNGFNPMWNETFEFFLNCSSLAILMIRVIDTAASARCIGYCAVRVENMRAGYRIIHLKDAAGHTLPLCNLFCRIGLAGQKFRQSWAKTNSNLSKSTSVPIKSMTAETTSTTTTTTTTSPTEGERA